MKRLRMLLFGLVGILVAGVGVYSVFAAVTTSLKLKNSIIFVVDESSVFYRAEIKTSYFSTNTNKPYLQTRSLTRFNSIWDDPPTTTLELNNIPFSDDKTAAEYTITLSNFTATGAINVSIGMPQTLHPQIEYSLFLLDAENSTPETIALTPINFGENQTIMMYEPNTPPNPTKEEVFASAPKLEFHIKMALKDLSKSIKTTPNNLSFPITLTKV